MQVTVHYIHIHCVYHTGAHTVCRLQTVLFTCQKGPGSFILLHYLTFRSFLLFFLQQLSEQHSPGKWKQGGEDTERKTGNCVDSVSLWGRPSPRPLSIVWAKLGEIEFSAALVSEETLTDTHELNANWRQQRFWELSLNGAWPWTENATIRRSWNHVCTSVHIDTLLCG